MTRLYTFGAVAVVLILLALGLYAERQHYGSTQYAAGETAGRNAVLADDAAAAAKAQQHHEQLEQSSADATAWMNEFLRTQLPANEAKSHASEESIRVIYRDRPVPADVCSRPAGVQEELDQAVDAANAAATHVQL